MKCLSALSSFTVKKFKENTIIYIIKTLLCIFHLYVAYFSYSTTFSTSLLFILLSLLIYSMTTCTLLYYIYYLLLFFFSLQSICTFIQHCVSFRVLLCLNLSYCESVILYCPGALLKNLSCVM